MSHHYRLFVSLYLLSVLAGACSITQPLGSSNANATLVAGMNIDPPIEVPTDSPGERPRQRANRAQKLVLAGGCFWGMEAVFEQLQGVSGVVSGFAGGTAATANYDTVSRGDTGHAEAIEITYDPQQISYGKLLKIYFLIAHDPTQIDRQEPDRGTQYRSAIFFATPQQQQVATAYIDKLNTAQIFSQPIATQLIPLTKFYTAEDYHQNFIDRHPNYPYIVQYDLPKIARLRQQFPTLISKSSR